MAVVTIVDNVDALVDASAGRIAALIHDSIAARGSAMVCLTGGETIGPIYERLGGSVTWRQAIDWSRVHLFWGDDRHVPPDHPDSNFGMANAAFVQRVPIPASHVHRIRTEAGDAHVAARLYDLELREAFAAAGRDSQTFDVMLLGMGEDAHVASLFPGSALLGVIASGATHEQVAAVWAGHLHAWRITLTPNAILDSRRILMIVSGAAKAASVHAALELPEDVRRVPAHLLRQGDDRVEWLLDRAAAGQVESSKFEVNK